MNTPYYLTAESRAILAARNAEIRAHLKQRREARESAHVRKIVAAAAVMTRPDETRFMVGGVHL